MAKHGWHWPREEQVANAFEDAFDLSGDDASATRVKAAWAALLPPFDSPIDPYEPEFDRHPQELMRRDHQEEC